MICSIPTFPSRGVTRSRITIAAPHGYRWIARATAARCDSASTQYVLDDGSFGQCYRYRVQQLYRRRNRNPCRSQTHLPSGHHPRQVPRCLIFGRSREARGSGLSDADESSPSPRVFPVSENTKIPVSCLETGIFVDNRPTDVSINTPWQKLRGLWTEHR